MNVCTEIRPCLDDSSLHTRARVRATHLVVPAEHREAAEPQRPRRAEERDDGGLCVFGVYVCL